VFFTSFWHSKQDDGDYCWYVEFRTDVYCWEPSFIKENKKIIAFFIYRSHHPSAFVRLHHSFILKYLRYMYVLSSTLYLYVLLMICYVLQNWYFKIMLIPRQLTAVDWLLSAGWAEGSHSDWSASTHWICIYRNDCHQWWKLAGRAGGSRPSSVCWDSYVLLQVHTTVGLSTHLCVAHGFVYKTWLFNAVVVIHGHLLIRTVRLFFYSFDTVSISK